MNRNKFDILFELIALNGYHTCTLHDDSKAIINHCIDGKFYDNVGNEHHIDDLTLKITVINKHGKYEVI